MEEETHHRAAYRGHLYVRLCLQTILHVNTMVQVHHSLWAMELRSHLLRALQNRICSSAVWPAPTIMICRQPGSHGSSQTASPVCMDAGGLYKKVCCGFIVGITPGNNGIIC